MHHLAGPDFLDGVLDAREGRIRLAHVLPYRCVGKCDGSSDFLSHTAGQEPLHVLARMSTSRFTVLREPGYRGSCTSQVCGMRHTSKPSSVRAATVSETPATQIEPFRPRSAAGVRPARSRAPGRSPLHAPAATAPTPSTWPWTTWPPSGSPARSAASRLTRSPAWRRPERAALEGLVHRLEGDRTRGQIDRGQADAVDGDRVAEADAVGDLFGRDPEGRSIGAVVDGGDGCELLDDAGEHDCVRVGRDPGVQQDIRADPFGLQRHRCEPVGDCRGHQALAEQPGRRGVAKEARGDEHG